MRLELRLSPGEHRREYGEVKERPLCYSRIGESVSREEVSEVWAILRGITETVTLEHYF